MVTAIGLWEKNKIAQEHFYVQSIVPFFFILKITNDAF
jgi:hypothetical protein